MTAKAAASAGVLVLYKTTVMIVIIITTTTAVLQVHDGRHDVFLLSLGYIPNGIEAVEAMLATASIGAIWSSASPDFGVSVSR